MLTVVCAYTQCKQEHTCIHTLQWLHPICGIHIQGNLRIFNHKMYANILYKMISAWLGRLITLKWKHFLVACTWSKPSPTGTEPKKTIQIAKKMVQQSLLLYSLLLAEWKQPKGPQGIYARLSGVQRGKKRNSEFTNGSTINTLSSLAHPGCPSDRC